MRQIMKHPRKTHNTSNSCSCTSCIYKSGSDRPSLQRLVLKKSKIDRLYYGKYIPLREKKLIDKLVRTRAVYDDIRAQLISDSGSSLQKTADFKAKTSTNEIQESGAILEIVNLVDKGALKSPNLSECCSCCSCSSTSHLHQNVHSRKIHHRKNARGDYYEREGMRYNMKNRRGVRFLPKHIKSDPCTCTFQFLGFGKKSTNLDSNIESSLNIDEEIQPRPRRPSLIFNDSKTKLKNKITEGLQMIRDSKTMLQDSLAIRAKESLEKVKHMKNKLKPIKNVPDDDMYVLESRKVTILKDAGRPSYEKIKLSQTRLKNKILEGGEFVENRARKSINKLKQTKNTINTNVKNSVDRLNLKRKQKKTLNVLSPAEQTELALKIRKDSIVKFKENLKKKILLKDWICEEPCIEGICDPKQCFQKLKIKKVLKDRRHARRDKMTHSKHREENVGISSNLSDIRMQTKSAKQTSKMQNNLSKGVTKQFQVKPALAIKKINKEDKEGFTKPQLKNKKPKLSKKYPKLDSSIERESNPRQVVRIGSSFSFNVEFYKENPPVNMISALDHDRNSQSSGFTLRSLRRKQSALKKGTKRSQVSLKLIKRELGKKSKYKPKARQTDLHKSVSVQCQCPTTIVDKKKNKFDLLPFECEPSICIPGECDPESCLKLIQKRLASHSKQSYTSSRKTKSTSSVTTKSKSSKAKQVQSAVIPRRREVTDKQKLKLRPRKVVRKPKLSNGNIVRIGSTFSFNIEFYKDSKKRNETGVDNWQGLNTFSIKPKTEQLVHDKKPKKGRKKHYRKGSYQNPKTSTTGTETVDNSGYLKTRDKSTGSNKYKLQPYECVPGTCIPGECNPNECMERIKKRYNTKEVSLGTLSPEYKSTHSHTKSRSKAAFVQSKPSTKGRKILVKSKIGDGRIRKPLFGSPALKNNAKQVVNIGSSFSFNIEFSKSYKGNDIEKDFKPSAKPINFSTRKKVKERGVDIEKKVGHVDTQIEKVRKAEKSSIVGPMLKRCFCTLNLYKKQKGDFNKYKKLPFTNNVFTVNTALVQSQYHSSVNIIKRKNDYLRKQSIIHLLPCTKQSTEQSLEITSGLSLDVKLISKSSKHTNRNSQIIAVAKSISNYAKMESPTKTGLNNYLERCVCAMNMQYDSKLRKLEPYECEPGVCTPGECDPYECQKLIMKRFLRRYSKVSSTDSKAFSISSSQTRKKPTQSHFTSAAVKPRQIDKPKLSKVKEAKQAVRIGSTFSFDVEFYKNRPRREIAKSKVNISTNSSAEKPKGKMKSEKYRHKQIYTKPNIQESDSQVNIETKHKESYTIDRMNRCFCTLKFHKKGKVKTSIGQNQTTPHIKTGIESVNRGQNTKGISHDQHLLPYECEPGFCTPGECNPYECLARINGRNFKETGVATIPTSITTSSNTIRANKKMKTRSVKMEQRKSNFHPIRRVRGPSARTLNRKSNNTKRQAVKIGSTFSFNIDFYKDTTNSQKARKKEEEGIKQHKRKPTQTKSKETKQKGRKISTNILQPHTKVLQTVQSPHKNMATMVKPFLKRCFCTLQLRNQRNVKVKSNKIKEKKYRSVMTMTVENKFKRKLDPNECEPGICIPYKCDPFECEQLIKRRLNQELNMNTSLNPQLLPYECEPNFCIPGKCDPYVCLEQIKKRNIKSTGILANGDKRTIGHNQSTSLRIKHKQLQSRKPSTVKTQKSKHTSKNKKLHRISKVSDANNKQALKLGSDISFNVEFYKNRGVKNLNGSRTRSAEMHLKPTQKSQKEKLQESKRHSTNQSQTLANTKSTKSGIVPQLQRCFCTLSLRKSQNAKEEEIQTVNESIPKKSVTNNIEATKSTVSAVSTFIKKCFCTLKLNTRKVPKSPQIKLEINPHKLKSKFVKLEPYECEPNTCIPGECDPYECEKRIRKRLLRESAADPIRFKHASKPTLTPTMKANNVSRATLAQLLRSNNGYTTRVDESKKKSSIVKNIDKLKHVSHNQGQSKQSVRIGSSFSFDIEFFKDKSGGNGDTPYHSKVKDVSNRSKKLTVKESKKQKYTEKTKRITKIGKGQGTSIRFGKHNSSQFAQIQTKSNSTLTDPHKRCFCTLQLHKKAAANNQNIPTQKQPLQITSQNKMTHTTISYKMTSPYECPPLMCIPNECDPYDCERKVKKLNLRHQGIGPKETKRIHQSVEVDHFPKYRSQKTQSNVIKKLPIHDHDQNIVEIPRFTNYLKKENWQGVKIGSNMSFNIEFYKELSTPSPESMRKLKSKDDKLYVKPKSVKNKQFDTNLVRKSRLISKKVVPSKRSHVRNADSQVHKNRIESKSSNTTNKLKRCFCTLKLQNTKTKSHVPYPQAYEVRRAVVKKYKENPIKETDSQVKCVNIQGVCRKIKCNSKKAHAKDNEMQTILSYKPKKFNKKCSETLLLMDSNIRIQSKKKRITWSSKKRLTKKQSAHPIYVPSQPCPCEISTTQMPKRKTQKRKTLNPPNDGIRTSHSDRRAKEFKTVPKIRTSKSLMLPKRTSNKNAKENIFNLVGNPFEAGDPKGKNIRFRCQCMHKNNKNRIIKHSDDANNERKESPSKGNKRFLTDKLKMETVAQKDGPCPYCGQCVKGGMGYFLLAKFNSCMKKIKEWSFEKTTKTIGALMTKGREEKKAQELKPLFNVYLDSDGLGIINKEEVTEKVTRFQTKIGMRERDLKKERHDKYCTCCLCLGKKGRNKNLKKKSKVKRKEKEDPICVCGSEVCAKDVKRMKKLSPKKKQTTPCYCGSPICAEETAMIDAIAQGSGVGACICQEEYKKRKEQAKGENAKFYKLLSAKHRQEDSERQKKRRKADQLVEESIRGNKNDALLVAESVIDVAKLGFTGISDIFRIVYRCAKDPKYTWNSMKAMAKDPSLIAKTLKETYSNSGVAARTKRIGMRISSMGSMEKTKQLLEQNAVTNYILHIADKDPKKRLRKRKKKPKPREQVDFNCNLYVSSLRKRPFMWIFNRWPSFYPHCLSFLNVWKQFAEVMTFLLAVVVWSPCIFAMEVCRAVICCTLCTG